MTIATHPATAKDKQPGSPLEVLVAFLKLGVTSFGGPIAHIGYFREEFVVRRRWLGEPVYADLVALCQFLPGPASSQVGFSMGLVRAGYWGGLAAWAGFRLPSAIALVFFAYGARALVGPVGMGLLHGLKLVAVAVVAQAVLGMARMLCPDRQRAAIAVLATALILYSSSSITEIGTILLGGIGGLLACRTSATVTTVPMAVPVSRSVGIASLAAFILLLIGLPLLCGFGSPPG
jgi:chromate transporter